MKGYRVEEVRLCNVTIHRIVKDGCVNKGLVFGSKKRAFKIIERMKANDKQKTSVVLFSNIFNCILDDSDRRIH